MKIRDSGMPSEEMWSKFFDTESILDKMEVNNTISNLMEIGCGYGTFTIPAAKRINGQLFAYDIEQEMIDFSSTKATLEEIGNIKFYNRDIIAHGTGLDTESLDYVMLFNILHYENPSELLNEVYRVLKKDGKAGIIHWRSDIETPRGPDLAFRPKPEQCIEWALQAGFKIYQAPIILKPYHFGLIIEKR